MKHGTALGPKAQREVLFALDIDVGRPNRAQRRAEASRIKRDDLSFDRVMAADAAFFDRNPGRSYRVRPAAAVEIEQIAAEGLPAETPEGWLWVMLVHQVCPGLRFRLFMAASGPSPAKDPGEDRARILWEFAADPDSKLHGVVMSAREFGL